MHYLHFSRTYKKNLLQVALKLVPDHKTFINALMAKDHDQNLGSLLKEMQTFVTLLEPLLEEIHSSLVHKHILMVQYQFIYINFYDNFVLCV